MQKTWMVLTLGALLAGALLAGCGSGTAGDEGGNSPNITNGAGGQGTSTSTTGSGNDGG